MYSFDMTSEQQMLVDTVHRYAEEQLRTVYRDAEESGAAPDEAIRTGWEIGLLPGSIGENFGGFGEYSAITSALYLEELGWGDVALSLHLLTPSLFAVPIALFGSKKQKEAYLPLFCDETIPKATAAIIEPVHQFDPGDLETVAEKVSDGFVISGRKTYVPLADQAELFLVYAQEKGTTQAFIVPADTPGLTVGDRINMMGAKALAVYNLELDNVKVSKANRLGGLKGIRINRLLTVSRIGLAAMAVGQARAAFEYALAYAKEREAFGEPIAHRQSIAFMLANMRIELEAARLVAWEAAYLYDQGEDASKSAVLAKQYADKAVLEVTDSAVQILGGHGYIREHPVELWMRNGRGFATWDGLLMA